jgi:hypothetical protein
MCASLRVIKFRFELKMRVHDSGQCLGGVDRLQTTIKINRGLDVFMTQKTSNGFVFAGSVLQVDRRGSVSELMNGNTQASGFQDTFSYLFA